jgi:hypothetical protein
LGNRKALNNRRREDNCRHTGKEPLPLHFRTSQAVVIIA